MSDTACADCGRPVLWCTMVEVRLSEPRNVTEALAVDICADHIKASKGHGQAVPTVSTASV